MRLLWEEVLVCEGGPFVWGCGEGTARVLDELNTGAAISREAERAENREREERCVDHEIVQVLVTSLNNNTPQS